MSIWMLVLGCWVFGSLPLAVLVGKLLACSGPSDEITLDVDVLLDRIFAEAGGQPA